MRTLLVLSCLLSTSLGAQMAAAQAPASQPPAPQAPAAPAVHRPVKRRPAPAAGVTVTMTVTDEEGGAPIGGVKVSTSIDGAEKDTETTAGGIARFLAMKPGEYRVRFEHENYITLERDIVVKGAALDLTVPLSAAPPPPKPPDPPPAAHVGDGKTYTPVGFNVADFLEHNLLSKEGVRVDQLGCVSGGRVVLLQLRGSMPVPVNDESAEEAYFTVVGEAQLSSGGHTFELNAASGSEMTLPSGSKGSLKQTGRTTLVLHVVQFGVPCQGTGDPMQRLR